MYVLILTTLTFYPTTACFPQDVCRTANASYITIPGYTSQENCEAFVLSLQQDPHWSIIDHRCIEVH